MATRADSKTVGNAKRIQDPGRDGRLFFPESVVNDNHFMQFLPKKYEYGGANRQGFVEKTDVGGAITLPLPKNLGEAYSAEWSSESIRGTGDEAARFTDDAGGGRGALSTFTDLAIEQLMKLVQNGVIPINVATGALAGSGIASNPYLATLFKGINFRKHSFSFELFAKSPKESGQIRRIINRFRYNMLPAYNVKYRSIFDYPSIFHIAFMDSSYLFDFKPCVLTDMTINYHGQGDAYYFDVNGNKIPASIILDLSFTETEIVTKDDFNDEDTPKPRGFASTPNNTTTGAGR